MMARSQLPARVNVTPTPEALSEVPDGLSLLHAANFGELSAAFLGGNPYKSGDNSLQILDAAEVFGLIAAISRLR